MEVVTKLQGNLVFMNDLITYMINEWANISFVGSIAFRNFHIWM